ncbi:MAG: tetratricopeptide repeat protein [Ignavibacteriales bacterium]|nr:tetratricopeptide repeat protein [Ignavibacteriales bacterium]
MQFNARSSFFSGISIFFLIVSQIGCGGSDQAVKEPETPAMPSPTEVMQKEVTNLRTQNESLQQQVAKCEVEKRTIVARVAELETELAEWKEKKVEPTPITATPTLLNPKESYANALRLFNERKYDEAEQLIVKVQKSDIHPTLLDNCEYWLGECAYGSRRYADAIEHFQKVFTFQISEKKDDAQIMIGNSYKAMGNGAKAAEAYETLLKKFPASPFVKRTKEKLEKLK